MSQSEPLRRPDLARPLDALFSWWATATFTPMATGAAVAYRTLFLTVQGLVSGRRLTFASDVGAVTLTVTEFDSRLDLRALTVGQVGDVRVAARDVRWDGGRFSHARAVLRNVHIRPSMPPTLVAAPVELEVDVAAGAFGELFGGHVPRLAGEVGPDGVARLRWARRPGAGHLRVDVDLVDSTVRIRPRGLTVRRARWAVPVRTPAYRLRLPDLPHGIRLTGVSFAPGVIRLTGTLPQWQLDVPRARLEHLVAQLASPRTLTRVVRWR
ncbi:hypothetical protein E4P42_15795 [Mycobacterium sp. PS03-16]|uniref:LmeA family phospholipid-binding protein n=1 Tax=Mycobacterium sp. PS03-16 TaxID=2559611 RepID=UPI001073756A|nr:LmeA family phospholipid-binding protein [Mycobacterium sp. PS03-16]TFV57360.1 hypothetical protein E4P42_15795 [Mycobacterium sp. PS03-16]